MTAGRCGRCTQGCIPGHIQGGVPPTMVPGHIPRVYLSSFSHTQGCTSLPSPIPGVVYSPQVYLRVVCIAHRCTSGCVLYPVIPQGVSYTRLYLRVCISPIVHFRVVYISIVHLRVGTPPYVHTSGWGTPPYVHTSGWGISPVINLRVGISPFINLRVWVILLLYNSGCG